MHVLDVRPLVRRQLRRRGGKASLYNTYREDQTPIGPSEEDCLSLQRQPTRALKFSAPIGIARRSRLPSHIS